MMATFDRVPDILDLHFNGEEPFPAFPDHPAFTGHTAFPDIDLRDEDFNALNDLDIEDSFFHQVEHQMKSELPDEYSTIKPDQQLDFLPLSAEDNDILMDAECSIRGEKRAFCAEADLSDLDNSDKLRRDCMWSSGPNANKFYRPADQTAAQAVITSPLMLNDDCTTSTPPTSYIHQYIEQFQEVLTNDASDDQDVCSVSSGDCDSSDDWSSIANESDVDQSVEVPTTPPATTNQASPFATTTLLFPAEESRNLSSGDHSYYTNMNDTNMLTPPESSDDESNDSIEDIEMTKAIASITTSCTTTKGIKTKLNTESLRQEIQRLADNRRGSVHPKFTIKIQMKAKPKQLKTMKHLKGLRRFANASTKSSTLALSTAKLSLLNPEDNIEKPKDARDMHNHMERQRRNELRNAFDYLKTFVPSVAKSDRASKQMILDKAIEFCHTVKYKEESLNKQRQALHEKKIALQKRIMQLQKLNSLQ